MLTVSLVNLPFADVAVPPLALLQLKTVTEEACGQAVRVRVLDLNNDWAKHLGLELYKVICGALDANMYGLGDWFFRQCAFPELEDNERVYFNRCFRSPKSQVAQCRQLICDKRRAAPRIVEELIDTYQLDREDVVGFTSMFCQSLASFAMARALKRRRPGVITAMGGANCESPMGQAIVRRVPVIDFAFSGPALRSFPQFVRALVDGDDAGPHAIAGVFSRRNVEASGVPVAAAGEELPIDHDIPVDYSPFLDALDQTFGRNVVPPRLLFETSRGCWWGERAHCTFCGLNKMSMGYRAMAPDRAVRLFDQLFTYADRCAQFDCVDNIMPKEYVREVLPRLQPPDHVTLFYEVKADLTRADLETLARAHVRHIQPGIEALSTLSLKLMRKGTSAFSNVVFLKHCRDVGIVPAWNLLVGFPGETEQVFQKYIDDIPRLVHLQPPSGAFPVRFDRYSPYFDKAADYNLDLHANDWYGYVYPFDQAGLDQIAYYFMNHDFEAPYLRALVKHLNTIQQRIEAWRGQWHPTNPRVPELTLRHDDGVALLTDTRFGTSRRSVIDEGQVAFLRFLNAPKRAHDLTQEFGVAGPDLLAWATDQQLLFEEDGRLLALVIDVAPARNAGRPADLTPAVASVA
jgi:ribosomal peptide maturation radical SAM protein 1